MGILGGIILYLGSVCILLTAAYIAAGAYFSDPQGKVAPVASKESSATTRPRLTKPAQQAASAGKAEPTPTPSKRQIKSTEISAKSAARRNVKAARRTKKMPAAKPRTARPDFDDPADFEATGTLGYAPADSRVPFFFNYRR